MCLNLTKKTPERDLVSLMLLSTFETHFPGVFPSKFDQVFASENQSQFHLTGKYFIVFQESYKVIIKFKKLFHLLLPYIIDI